jgi:hypothetical protein
VVAATAVLEVLPRYTYVQATQASLACACAASILALVYFPSSSFEWVEERGNLGLVDIDIGIGKWKRNETVGLEMVGWIGWMVLHLSQSYPPPLFIPAH